MEQRTTEWLMARLGHCTASRFGDATAVLKSGQPAASAIDYGLELAAERLTGVLTERYVTSAMQWGIDMEADARAAYEYDRCEAVTEAGFIRHPTIKFFGASPDGLVGNDGLIEIKCPTSKRHAEWLHAGTVPDAHKPQMIAQLACTSRKWCDFVSYDPRYPDAVQLFVVRFEPLPEDLEKAEQAAARFIEYVNSIVAKIIGTPVI